MDVVNSLCSFIGSAALPLDIPPTTPHTYHAHRMRLSACTYQELSLSNRHSNFKQHSISNQPSISNVHSISNQHPFSERNSIIGTQFFKSALVFRWAHDFEFATDFRRLCIRFWNDHQFYLNDFCMIFDNFTGIRF